MGSTSDDIYGCERFMDLNELVTVTVNYRLGPLGFLCLGKESCPGNQVNQLIFCFGANSPFLSVKEFQGRNSKYYVLRST